MRHVLIFDVEFIFDTPTARKSTPKPLSMGPIAKIGQFWLPHPCFKKRYKNVLSGVIFDVEFIIDTAVTQKTTHMPLTFGLETKIGQF